MAALPASCGRQATNLDAPPAGRERRLAGRTPGLRVLVAEDNPVHRAYLLQILADLGHRPEAAINGMEAVKLLGMIDFDLAFLDLRMPALGGEEVLRSIRDGFIARADPCMPVVAVSAQTERGLRARMSTAGFDVFIGKPLRRSDVLQALETATSQTAPASPAVDLEAAGDWLCNGEAGIFRRILAIFVEQAGAFQGETSVALAARDSDKIRFAGHSMANSAGMLRAERLRVAALVLERAAQQRDLEAVRQALDKVERELVMVVAAARAYLGRGA